MKKADLKSGRYVFYVKGDRKFLVSVPEKDVEGVYSKRRIYLLDDPEVVYPDFNIFGVAESVSMFVANLTFPKGQAKISKITRQEFCNTERILNNFVSIKREINQGTESVLITNELKSYREYKSRKVLWKTYIGTFTGTTVISHSIGTMYARFVDCIVKNSDGSFEESDNSTLNYDKNLALQGLGSINIGDRFMFEVPEEIERKSKKSIKSNKAS